jgi:cytochrome P450
MFFSILVTGGILLLSFLGWKRHLIIHRLRQTSLNGPFRNSSEPLVNWLGWPVLPTDPHIFVGLQRLAKKYGRRFIITWPIPIVFASDPDDIRTVLSIANLPKQDLARIFEVLTGPNLVSSDHYQPSGKWHTLQPLFKPSFTKTNIRLFLPKFVSHAERFVRSLTQIIGSSTRDINIRQYWSRITMDIIADTAFGLDMQSIDGKNEEIRQALETTMEIVGDLKNIIPGIVYVNKLRTYFPRQIVNRVISEAIAKRRVILNSDPLHQSSVFLDSLLTMDDQTIQDQIFMMFLAGTDTTTSALSWVCLLLARHPAILARARDEAQAFLTNGTITSFRIDRELGYLTQVIKETLRLHPVAPFLGRETPCDGFMLGENFIPGGITIATCSILAHHDPELWPNPDVFDPDRFESGNEGRHSHAYIPFMAGSRICLGMNFFWAEAKILLAHFITHFDFEQPSELRDKPLEGTWKLLMHPTHPVLSMRSRTR